MARRPPVFRDHPIRYVDALAQGVFRAYCSYVSDGDTCDCLLDLGWYQYAYVSIRLADVDTCELRGTRGVEREMAERAKSLAESLVLDRPVILRSYQVTTFGRHVAAVYCQDLAGEYGMLPAPVDAGEDDIRWVSLADVLCHEKLTKADVPGA